MKELLKLIKRLLAKGFATPAEKAEVAKLYKALPTSEQGEVADQVADVKDLDEEDEDAEEEKDEDEDEDVSTEDVEKTLEKILNKKVKTLEATYDKKLQAAIAEHKEMATKRVGLYNPEVQEDRKAKNVLVRKFITALVDNDTATLKDISSGGSGGYLLDTDLVAEVQFLQTEYGVCRREMTTTPITSKSLDLTNIATDLEAYWTDEGSAKTSSEVVFGQPVLTLKKMAVIVPMTDEILEDSAIDLVGFLTGRIAEKMAAKEDAAFLKGDGTSGFGSFTGILNNANVNTVTMTGTTFASITADDLIDMQDETPQGAHANGKYFMHRTIMSYVRKLKDDQNAYIYQAPSATGPATIWGKPVVLSEAMPSKSASDDDTPFVIFGDLRKAAWLGYRGGLRVKLSDEATVRNSAGNADIDLFRQDMTALRVVERVGFVVTIPTAVTVLFTAAASV